MASFDDAALSKLTAKIDQKLSGTNKPRPASQGKTDLKRKRPEEKPEPAKKKRNEQPKLEKRPPRDRQERATERKPGKFDKKNQKSPNGAPVRKPSQNGVQATPDVLLDEIKALGGDEKDLELVGNVDSEDENFGADDKIKKPDKSLQAELAKFALGLGFDNIQPEEVAEDDVEEVEDDEAVQRNDDDEWEDASAGEGGALSSRDRTRDATQSAVRGTWKTIFEPRPDWHAAVLKRLPEPLSDDLAGNMAAISALKSYAKTILDEDSSTYNTTLASSSSHKFMATIMSSGTMSDKTSALTLAIQESPVHSIKPIESLITLAGKRSRGQALAASAALVDLLGPGTLLPSGRRLRAFATQPGLVGTLQQYKIKTWSSNQALPGHITKEHLISWVYEDWLKEAYFRIIQSLEIWSNDEIEHSRVKSIDMVYALLKDKPEQESNLLRLLVNKLGDRERKIASRASYLLLQLLNIHPGMKSVVVQTVEQEVIFRPGQNIRAKYYAINTLNQTILSSKEPQIADKLLKIYFGLFVGLLKSGDLGQVESFSAAESNQQPEKSKSRKRGRTTPHGKNPGEEKVGQPERESAEKLVSAILTGINRAVPFSETDSSTLESHLDTLFRITHSSNFNTSIQALMLIQQMAATRHLATERFFRTLYESLLDPRLTTSSKQGLYLNLLYRSLKSDVDVRRVKAFVKRMLQVLNLHQPSFVCGILYLIIELYATFPDLSTLLNEPEEHDDIEDMPKSTEQDDVVMGEQAPRFTDAYDGRKRVPEYSNAHRSCLWELIPFLNHFHPSVDLYATNLLQGNKSVQKPELTSHTLINFLDKFVYKNPKATDTARGNSLMQPVTAAGQGSVLVSTKAGSKTGASLNSATFWNKKVNEVAAEDVFFHEYFNQIGKPSQPESMKKTKKDPETIDDEDSEAAEDEIWEALKSSKPEVQGDSESELDSDFEDMMDDGSDEEPVDEDVMDVDGISDGSGPDFSDASSLDFSDEDEDASATPAAAAVDGKPESEHKKRRRMLKGLPTFASVDDYAEMLAKEEDGL